MLGLYRVDRYQDLREARRDDQRVRLGDKLEEGCDCVKGLE
jgi:hypothetical protein